MNEMFLNKTTVKFILFFAITLSLGCTSKESDAKQLNSDIKQPNISFIEAADVNDCTVDYDDINFCTSKRLKSYNDILEKKIVNFDKDKHLTTFEHNNATYFVVIDLKKEKVFSFPASIRLLKNEKLNFDKNNNKICFKGDYLEYRNTYINVSSCFSYLNGQYKNEFMDELSVNDSEINNNMISHLTNNNVKTINLPASSNSFEKCTETKSLEECNKLYEKNDYTYSNFGDGYFEKGSILEIFFAKEKIKEKIEEINNINSFRFIPNDKEIIYAIAMKQFEYGDDYLSQQYYLIKLKPEVIVTPLGEEYTIDQNYVLRYKDENGVTKKISVK